MSFDIRFDVRRMLTASLLSAALALPAMAQDATEEEAPATSVQPTEAAPAEAATATAELPEPVVLEDLYLGEESAPLTIYEYASFTCPHCAAFHRDSFPQLKAEYIDTGKVRFVQRDIYFDQVGLWAGILARCDSDKFYPVADMLMSEQDDWMGSANGEELVASLRTIGAKAGMTAEQVDACWADQELVQNLVATFQHNAEADNISATPTFMIGGEQVENQAWADLKVIIDDKLAEAEAAAPAAAN